MKNHKIHFLSLLIVCITNIKSIGYKNPILPGFYPDPSVCVVNDAFYLVNSSFEYFPGVPIWKSTDLIHWQQIGHCLTRNSQLELHGVSPSAGIFAPTIRFHNGLFYMVTTNVSKGGNFYVTAKNPTDEWSEPIFVDQGGIDPTLFWDNDNVYFLSTANNEILLSEINILTGKRLTEPRRIWYGTGGRYPEGPHIYKKDGYYYLLIAEGGTEYDHKVTIARSKFIDGPYESNPANPILTHANATGQHNAIQGLGHADFVEAPNGSWWAVFLGFRPQVGKNHLLGRETFLAPVQWPTGAWPVINQTGTVSLNMQCETLKLDTFPAKPTIDNFDPPILAFHWNFLRNPITENYSLVKRKGFLQMLGSEVTLNENASPTFVGRRQQAINFEASTLFESKTTASTESGLTVYMNPQNHYDVFVSGNTLSVRCKLGNLNVIVKKVNIEKSKIFIKVIGASQYYTFLYSLDGKSFKELCKLDTRYLSSECAGGFTGIYIGLYVSGKKAIGSFDWFNYKNR